MCCDTKRGKIVARNPSELRPVLGEPCVAGNAACIAHRADVAHGRHVLLAPRLHAARSLRPSQRLAHDNFTKAQAAGL